MKRLIALIIGIAIGYEGIPIFMHIAYWTIIFSTILYFSHHSFPCH